MKKTISLLCLCLLTACSDNKQILHIYTWSDYFDPELIQLFEQQNDCKVVIDTFDSNEQMYAKLKAGAVGYDIMTPSSYQVEMLYKENLILEINHNLLTNVVKNFNHDLDDQVLDKSMKWSIPYVCTYTGIMCQKNLANKSKSWNVFSDSKYKGKMTLLDDIREVVGIGLMHNGYSLNSTNEQEIGKAVEYILKIKKNIRKFDAESYKLEVANNSSLIGHGYSSDAFQIILSEREDIEFVLPDEGFTIAWDEFVISSHSTQIELAYKFIDFFYDADIASQNMIYVCGLMANEPAFEKLPTNYKNMLMPKNLDKGQVLKGFSDQKTLNLYNKAWDKIKAIEK